MAKFIVLLVLAIAVIIPNTIGSEELPASADEWLEEFKPLSSRFTPVQLACEGLKDEEKKECYYNGFGDDQELVDLQQKYEAIKETLTTKAQRNELRDRRRKLQAQAED